MSVCSTRWSNTQEMISWGSSYIRSDARHGCAEKTHKNIPYRYSSKHGHLPKVVLMLGQRRRRWTNIKTAFGECPVFAGYYHVFDIIIFFSKKETLAKSNYFRLYINIYYFFHSFVYYFTLDSLLPIHIIYWFIYFIIIDCIPSIHLFNRLFMYTSILNFIYTLNGFLVANHSPSLI